MSTNKPTITVDGKEIDLKNWLTTIEAEQSNKRFAKTALDDYSDIGINILSLLAVCRQAIEAQKYGMQIADGLHFGRVLGIVMGLVPLSEFELLDKLMPAVFDMAE